MPLELDPKKVYSVSEIRENFNNIGIKDAQKVLSKLAAENGLEIRAGTFIRGHELIAAMDKPSKKENLRAELTKARAELKTQKAYIKELEKDNDDVIEGLQHKHRQTVEYLKSQNEAQKNNMTESYSRFTGQVENMANTIGELNKLITALRSGECK